MGMKLCFKKDNDGHSYCIPIHLVDDFNYLIDNELHDKFTHRFEKYFLTMHISNYCFENLEERV